MNISYADFLNHNDIAESILADGDVLTTHIMGETGIGKSAIAKQIARALPTHTLSIIDMTQVSDGSIWMPIIDLENGVSDELPNKRFGISKHNHRGIEGSRPVLIFIDEYNKGSRYAKQAAAPIIYERRLGSLYLPDGSIVMMASNLGMEGYGDTSHMFLKTREGELNLRKPTADELVTHATEQGWEAEVIAFIKETPQVCDSFLDYSKEYGGKYAGRDQTKENQMILNPNIEQGKIASPRTLEFASLKMRGYRRRATPMHVVRAGLAGVVGEACAKEMVAFFQFGSEAEPFENVVADPLKARLPANPMVQMVQMFKYLSRVTDRAEADAVTRYMKRCRDEMQVLFCRRVTETSSLMSLFITVSEFSSMMRDGRIYFKGE
jgi:hypothetical protein